MTEMIVITIRTNNDAFRNNEGTEVGRILNKIAYDVTGLDDLGAYDTKYLYDENGNRVGVVTVD